MMMNASTSIMTAEKETAHSTMMALWQDKDMLGARNSGKLMVSFAFG